MTNQTMMGSTKIKEEEKLVLKNLKKNYWGQNISFTENNVPQNPSSENISYALTRLEKNVVW